MRKWSRRPVASHPRLEYPVTVRLTEQEWDRLNRVLRARNERQAEFTRGVLVRALLRAEYRLEGTGDVDVPLPAPPPPPTKGTP